MRFTSLAISDGVSERLFTLDDIPGVLWSPADSAGNRPVVLMGHGGGQHKLAPGVAARARSLVTGGGFAVVAIDAPGHGDRPRSQRDEQFAAGLRDQMAAGQPVGARVAAYNAEISAQAVPEWRSVLDALQAEGAIAADRPAGFQGLAMGTAVGLWLAAAEPRIGAAFVGLAGDQALAQVAARVTIPVLFLLQWDDELVPRADALALFGALASRDKTLHANPGGHRRVPAYEIDGSLRFFARHLLGESGT